MVKIKSCIWVKLTKEYFSCQIEDKKSDKYMFDNIQYDDSEEDIVNTTQNLVPNLKRYSSLTGSFLIYRNTWNVQRIWMFRDIVFQIFYNYGSVLYILNFIYNVRSDGFKIFFNGRSLHQILMDSPVEE